MAKRGMGLAGDPSLDVQTVQGDPAGTPLNVTPTAAATAAVGNTTYTTVQVSPTGTAGTLIAAGATRKVLILRALASNSQSVWVGAATVTATTGMEFPPGAEKAFTGADVPVHLLQAITTSGTQVMVVTTGV